VILSYVSIDTTHPTVEIGGCGTLCTFNYESIFSSFIAVIATIGVGLWLRSQLRYGAPTRVQAVFEWGYDQLRSLIKTNVSEDALFIIPLALTLFLYILVANWIELLPLGLFRRGTAPTRTSIRRSPWL
jgi:F-type H+-transporting ATPase subunit a